MDMFKAHLSVVILVDGEMQTSFWLVGRKVMRHMTSHHRYGLWCLAIWRRVRVHFTSSCALQKNGRYWLGFCSLLHGVFSFVFQLWMQVSTCMSCGTSVLNFSCTWFLAGVFTIPVLKITRSPMAIVWTALHRFPWLPLTVWLLPCVEPS
jgi:hypothetical protein